MQVLSSWSCGVAEFPASSAAGVTQSSLILGEGKGQAIPSQKRKWLRGRVNHGRKGNLRKDYDSKNTEARESMHIGEGKNAGREVRMTSYLALC